MSAELPFGAALDDGHAVVRCARSGARPPSASARCRTRVQVVVAVGPEVVAHERMMPRSTDDELDRIAARAGPSCRHHGSRSSKGAIAGGDGFIRTGGLDEASPDVYVTVSHSNQRTNPARHTAAPGRLSLPRHAKTCAAGR